jgi:hypothetical protein
MVNRVLIDRLRRVGLPIAALIGGDGPEPGVRQCPQLMAPGVPDLREAVTEEHREAAAGFDDVHADAVGVDVVVDDVGHGRVDS